MPHALLVDDDLKSLHALEAMVQAEGFTTSTASNLADAQRAARQAAADIAVVDLVLPDGSGLDLLDGDAQAAPTPTIVLTGRSSVSTAVEALRRGALDYLLKPVDLDRLRGHLTHASSCCDLEDFRRRFRTSWSEDGFGPMIGRSASMRQLYQLIGRIASSDAPALLLGETGTGKELAARMIHDLSARHRQTMVSVNCGAVPEHLIESELFGHEKGSFTGAHRTHRGVFERASGGSLFLDEIGELPLALQARLLRILDDGTYCRVGGERVLQCDVRMIAATHRNLARDVDEGRFREDLYYRLAVVPITVPPLRDRGDDIVLLADRFLDQINRTCDDRKEFTPEVIEALRCDPWPGNVRQLRNEVQRLHLLSDQRIEADLMRRDRSAEDRRSAEGSDGAFVGKTLAHMERRLIEATLEHFAGHRERTARALGISQKTLYNRLKAYRGDTAGDDSKA